MNEAERWAPAPAPFSEVYQISTWGRIRRLATVDDRGTRRRERILRGFKGGGGYPAVMLSWGGNRRVFYVAHLVLRVFCGEPEPGQVCVYLGDRSEVSVDKVRWGWPKGRSKPRRPMEEYVKQFLVRHRDSYPIERLAGFAGCAPSTVRRILRDADQAAGEQKDACAA